MGILWFQKVKNFGTKMQKKTTTTNYKPWLQRRIRNHRLVRNVKSFSKKIIFQQNSKNLLGNMQGKKVAKSCRDCTQYTTDNGQPTTHTCTRAQNTSQHNTTYKQTQTDRQPDSQTHLAGSPGAKRGRRASTTLSSHNAPSFSRRVSARACPGVHCTVTTRPGLPPPPGRGRRGPSEGGGGGHVAIEGQEGDEMSGEEGWVHNN